MNTFINIEQNEMNITQCIGNGIIDKAGIPLPDLKE